LFVVVSFKVKIYLITIIKKLLPFIKYFALKKSNLLIFIDYKSIIIQRMKKNVLSILAVSCLFLNHQVCYSQSKKGIDAEPKKSKLAELNTGGLSFRSVGPALTSGRIADFAVNPNNSKQYYVAVASGGVWKTDNAGTTYQPVFDGEGSFSIGAIAMDQNNTNTVWIGTGENNNQRSVAYGDGVYKTEDGGKSWVNMGLKTSEHIADIIIHPSNSNVIFVAAYGPLWKDGGERGVYKTIDGGKNWERILFIDEQTGISDLIIDPNNSEILYASAHQRRRHVWTYLGGGPNSGIHKTEDGGKTWKKLTNGIPEMDKGRIAITISKANSNRLYAMIEAGDEKGGLYRSDNKGASFDKVNSFYTAGNYYEEIFADPKNADRVFIMDTWLRHSDDGGKNIKMTGEKNKHVDNHALWIDPNDSQHWLVGCDGGIYETWDNAENWQYKPNLPVTQFYRVAVDNNLPFYNIYGGTQDNNSMGGPSRTTSASGILNTDWYITNGGDGFEPQIDPTDANIVYAQSQYGGLVRYDKKSGENIYIQPQPGKGEPGLRWNWDSPLLISPHNNQRLYFAANKLFRSDDRGNSWKAVSDDLSRQIDRNKLKVMGKVWSMDAVSKNQSTSIYGNIVALDESTKKEGLIAIGTDDGLIQITENGGDDWRKIETFSGIPANTYVNMVKTSQHDENIIYAVFNNHKMGDFKPYILKSSNKGATWVAIQSNLPERGSVYCIAEDHINPNLLFVGTEFGFYFTLDGGKEWIALKNGLPTISVKDIAIQQREDDIVIATFGRGFYVLDNYAALREISNATFEKEAVIFPIKKSLIFNPSYPQGGTGKSSLGESLYNAENPPIGAVFTTYLKDTYKTKKETRKEKEKDLIKQNQDVFYPSIDEIRIEDSEEKPFLIYLIKDELGNEVKKIKTNVTKGISRVVWNFRYSTTTPINLNKQPPGPWESEDDGPLAMSGKYSVTLFKSINGVISELVAPVFFEIENLNNLTLPAADKKALMAFQQEVSELRRSVQGAVKLKSEIENRLKHIKQSIIEYPTVPMVLMEKVKVIEKEFSELDIKLFGDGSLASREFETAPGLYNRIENTVYSTWYMRSSPTQTNIDDYNIAKQEYDPILIKIKEKLIELDALEKELDKEKTPYTPGRNDSWKKE
jgi:photosystem II stability/assembly factor-like uncharacterized protein